MEPSDDGDEDGIKDDGDSTPAASDVEMLDSDVEVASQSSKEDEDADSDDQSEANGQEQGDDDDDDDEELAAFDAKLAAALGTRKGEDDLDSADTSGSDEDMDDDEMEALDEQLATVFRARKDLTNKKKENKEAKGNIVQFKTRVLDRIEAYLKQEYQNPLALVVVVPLLVTARKTRTKQISDRACQILREFCSRCKGKTVPAETNVATAKEILGSVHEEACLQSSQTHATACSQASILLVKVLVAIDSQNVLIAVETYADTRKKQLTDKKCHVQPSFFTDWNNWCTSASRQMRE